MLFGLSTRTLLVILLIPLALAVLLHFTLDQVPDEEWLCQAVGCDGGEPREECPSPGEMLELREVLRKNNAALLGLTEDALKRGEKLNELVQIQKETIRASEELRVAQLHATQEAIKNYATLVKEDTERVYQYIRASFPRYASNYPKPIWKGALPG
jgi:hypothetical protein